MLLSQDFVLKPAIVRATFGSRDACVQWEKTDGEIHLDACLEELRSVIISDTEYKMRLLSANPVTSSSLDLEFSVGLDNSPTRIEILNSIGEVIQTIYSGIAHKGEYHAKLSTTSFPSGVYSIRMTSGEYSALNNFIILK